MVTVAVLCAFTEVKNAEIAKTKTNKIAIFDDLNFNNSKGSS
jgi:hypothetical protein